jgi:hypothetical protein
MTMGCLQPQARAPRNRSTIRNMLDAVDNEIGSFELHNGNP